MSNPEKDPSPCMPGQLPPPMDGATAQFTPEEVEADPVLEAYAVARPHLTECDERGIILLIRRLSENAGPTAEPER